MHSNQQPVYNQLTLACKKSQWGLVPSWTRPNEANKVNVLINARRETVTELPSFARALNSRISRRCVVASTGFYEWERGPSRTSRKTPYLIRLHHETSSGDSDGRVLLMAGVYDVWKTPDRSELYSFAICTTATSEQFSWLHDRLPCILETEADVTAWLDVAGLPGRAAAATVLRTAAAPLEWTRMSADLATPVGKPSSRAVKQDVTAYFSAGGAKTGAAKAPFPKSFAERVGLDLLPSPAKLAQLDTPIKKAHAAGSARRSPPGKASRAKASPKKSAAKGQRSITSFFRKQGENG